ncbi:MAG: hypothetical protein JNL11_02170 [Bdellovibrionaceae bacterium]|nr:hypothetical protein [Pseudobdellovibrionaceae bacterium]
MKEPSKDQIKDRAKFLRQILKEKHNIDLPHGHALEALAKVFGFSDWNTASAMTDKGTSESKVESAIVEPIPAKEKPVAAKLQKAGELADFFNSFDREKLVFVNEYKDSSPNDKNPKSISDFLAGTMTSVCSLTYDSEIQVDSEIRLELNTESERNFQLNDFGKSATQSFERTGAGRSQRRVKYLSLFRSFWTQ